MVLFHRHFGEVKISTSTLHQLYKKNGIKRKALRFVKTSKYQEPEKRAIAIRSMIDSLKQAIANGKRIIFSDEAVFSTATLLDRAYAPRKDNVSLEERLVSSPAVAVVAGVSADAGLEGYFIRARSIDSECFI